MDATLHQIPIDEIVVTGNPRTIFDNQGIQDLALNIKTNGLIQPLVLRRQNGHYELVAGARRLRALKLLKWKEAPSIVQEYQDNLVSSVRLGENTARVDLHPIEEADEFERIRKEHNLTPKQVAEATGQPVQRVVARLPLAGLGQTVRRLVLKDKAPLQPGHLEILSRVLSDSIQGEMAREILKPPHSQKMLDVQESKKVLERYQISLSRAQFNTADPKLTKAGACTTCPYNTRNLPRDLYPNKDVCVAIDCFRNKQHAHFVQLSNSGKYQVIKDGKGIFDSGWGKDPHIKYNSPYSSEDSESYKFNYRKLKTIFKEHPDLAPPAYLAFDPHSHQSVVLYKDKEAEEAIQKIKRASGERQTRVKSSWEIQNDAKRKREAALGKRLQAHVFETIKNTPGGFKVTLESVADSMLEYATDYRLRDYMIATLKERGIEPPKGAQSYNLADKLYERFAADAKNQDKLEVLLTIICLKQIREAAGLSYVNPGEKKRATQRIKTLLGFEPGPLVGKFNREILAEEKAKKAKAKVKGKKKAAAAKKEAKPERGVCRVCGCTFDNPRPEGCAWTDHREILCTSCE